LVVGHDLILGRVPSIGIYLLIGATNLHDLEVGIDSTFPSQLSLSPVLVLNASRNRIAWVINPLSDLGAGSIIPSFIYQHLSQPQAFCP